MDVAIVNQHKNAFDCVFVIPEEHIRQTSTNHIIKICYLVLRVESQDLLLVFAQSAANSLL